jgi:hypothetical protein
MINKNLEFLTELDKKLHKITESTFTPNLSGRPFPIFIDEYSEEKMTKEEIEEVLKISQKMNYLICPINTCMGFSVGYDVCNLNPLKKGKSVLRFKEGQLPKEYTFEKMSETFMKKSNLLKAKILGVEIINDYDEYSY